MKSAAKSSLGTLIATALQRSWTEPTQPDCDISVDELDQVAPMLYESGAAGLGWWRFRETKLRETASGELLHQAFRMHTLHAAIHETRIQKVFRVFRAANIEPILIKGWAVARVYPEPALRPYGDIDLLIKPPDYEVARRVVESEAREFQIDLHAPAFELADRSLEDLYRRSALVSCGAEQVRVLSAEDHFALLAVHLLKHGAWRPLWLCDLGLLLETAHDFDWDLCLGKDRRRANWILSAAGLAHKLLNAHINDERISERAEEVPDWLVQSVLKQWETPFAGAHAPATHPAPIRSYLTRPRGLLPDLLRRWPNPILATVSVNGTFGVRPRLRYQLGNCLIRARRVIQSFGSGRPHASFE